MSISSILTSLESKVSDVLGNQWSTLDYVYELEDNSFKTGHKRFGVGVSSGSSVAGTSKAVTYDFTFFVVLASNYVNKSSDENERSVLSDIYDQFNEIDKNVFQKKLNNASVLVVSELSYDSPERIDKNTISVRVDFTVKFRNQTA